MYAQFSAAHRTVKYAVVLNESYQQPNPSNGETGSVHLSTCLCLVRRESDIALFHRVFQDTQAPTEHDISIPAELLIALSLLAIEQYRPPAYHPPPEQPLPRLRSDHLNGPGSGRGAGQPSTSAQPPAGAIARPPTRRATPTPIEIDRPASRLRSASSSRRAPDPQTGETPDRRLRGGQPGADLRLLHEFLDDASASWTQIPAVNGMTEDGSGLVVHVVGPQLDLSDGPSSYLRGRDGFKRDVTSVSFGRFTLLDGAPRSLTRVQVTRASSAPLKVCANLFPPSCELNYGQWTLVLCKQRPSAHSPSIDQVHPFDTPPSSPEYTHIVPDVNLPTALLSAHRLTKQISSSPDSPAIRAVFKRETSHRMRFSLSSSEVRDESTRLHADLDAAIFTYVASTPPSHQSSVGLRGDLDTVSGTIKELSLGAFRGSGAVWTVFDLVSSSSLPPSSPSSRSVVKLASASWSSADPHSGAYTPDELDRAIVNDINMHLGPLAGLQRHGVMPRLTAVGVSRRGPGNIWAMVMQDAGDPVDCAALLPHER